MKLVRHPDNPIVWPGELPWRRVATFNPGVVRAPDGTFYMLERAVSSLAPLFSHFGLLRSEDGVRFSHVQDTPVFSAADLGTPLGTVEDPRVIRLDDRYVMTYVHRNYASSCFPRGLGVPNYHNPTQVPPDDPNHYRSGLAVSDDLIHWEDLGLITPREVDDRDCVLFPERIGGRYAMLRRPLHFVGGEYGCDRPAIWISYSEDLRTWTAAELVAAPRDLDWEAVKIGAAASPLATPEGWLTFYHGVSAEGVYRTGLMLLDRANPAKVIARSPEYIQEPEAYYERFGLIIPNVVFASAAVRVDDTIHVYYGCCDTSIALATVSLERALAFVRRFPV